MIDKLPWPAACGLLLLLCLALYLPGLTSLPPLDRDEARFAQATKQMLEEKDFVRIRFQDQGRHKKPVGIYWMQAAAAGATDRTAIWPYRLPSVLGAVLAVLLTFSLGRRVMGARHAFLGAALLACSLILVVEAHLAKTDAMLLASIVAMQSSLGWFYLSGTGEPQRASRGPWLLFWGAMALSILIKGPIGPLFPALTILFLSLSDRRAPRAWNWLRPLKPIKGLILVAALVSPWFVAVTLSTDGAFLREAVGEDLLPKLFSSQQSHGAPPGYYLLLFTLTFWPGSLLAWPALFSTWGMRAGDRRIRFLWAWILPNWILFEAVITKLPHYVMPVYPAVALLIALWLESGRGGDGPPAPRRTWPTHLTTGLWTILGAFLALGLVAAPVYIDKAFSPWSAAAAILVAGTTILALIWNRSATILRVCAVLIVGSTLTFGIILARGMPEMRGFWTSRSVQQTLDFLRAEHPELTGPVAAAGYHEPSMVFLLGTDTRLVSHAAAATHLANHPRGSALVEARNHREFQAGLDKLDIRARRLAVVRGFNYSKGHWVDLGVYAREDAPSGNAGRAP